MEANQAATELLLKGITVLGQDSNNPITEASKGARSDESQGSVNRWYCDRLRPILDLQIATLVKRVGASPRSVQVRELGYRWGSCGHKGDLYFHAPCGDAATKDD
jgi:predicted metal-dependent hydrolase